MQCTYIGTYAIRQAPREVRSYADTYAARDIGTYVRALAIADEAKRKCLAFFERPGWALQAAYNFFANMNAKFALRSR